MTCRVLIPLPKRGSVKKSYTWIITQPKKKDCSFVILKEKVSSKAPSRRLRSVKRHRTPLLFPSRGTSALILFIFLMTSSNAEVYFSFDKFYSLPHSPPSLSHKNANTYTQQPSQVQAWMRGGRRSSVDSLIFSVGEVWTFCQSSGACGGLFSRRGDSRRVAYD